MTDYIALLERAAERGEVRGPVEVLRRARRNVRQRRMLRFGAVLVGACVLAGVVGLRTGDDESRSASVAAALQGGVAYVPEPARFDVVGAGVTEGWENPSDLLGHVELYQRLDDAGAVSAAVAVAVSDQRQTTLLSVLPLAEGTARGSAGDYRFGSSDATNGLVVVERKTATARAIYSIRVAGRGLDADAVITVLESIVVDDDGTIATIDLPPGLDDRPVYRGPDTSGIGIAPAVSTIGVYRHRGTGDTVRITTLRNSSMPPVASLAWFFEGSVVTATSTTTVTQARHLGDHLTFWNVDESTRVVVTSPRQLPSDVLADLQDHGQMVDTDSWNQLRREHPLGTAETSPTTRP